MSDLWERADSIVKQIGILGGTFNPIHIGHLAIAQTVLDKLGLDKIVFVPSFFPPHKSEKNLVPAADRLRMVQLAVEGNSGFEVSDFEIQKGGKSYSVDTVTHFTQILPPKSKIFFIIGEDAVAGLPDWRRINDLAAMAIFVVVNRKGFEHAKSAIPARSIEMPALDISSSEIRKKIRAGESIQYLVPEKVAQYIQKNDLYQ
ncbi:MAG: nicotinate-nucleotide adenylyltransferase [Candidatus Omnitrophica bacterium]|nr:nicotinate-nucleotide adenylyltransferase [Candidatus Omnitrophota bacterium]